MALRKQMFVMYGLVLLVTLCHAENGKNNSTIPKEATPKTECNDKSNATVTRPIMSARPKQNITLNDLLTALLNIQKNHSTTENPIVNNNEKPVTDGTVVPVNPTTPNPEINIADILSGGGKTNQSVIILNIGDLLRAKEQQILNGLNDINCQQGYIYVLLPGGQGKFIPLNQADMLPQNGVPNYIILLANGQPNFLQSQNWQQINKMLPNLGINIPGLSKIGTIPIYAPTNFPSSGVGNSNIEPSTLHPSNNPNFPTNPNNVVSLGGVGLPNHQLYPVVNNPNKMPVQPTDTSNNWNFDLNIPGININLPTQAPQPTNTGVQYPNLNIIQQPSQPNRVPNINNLTFAVNVPNQPNQLVNTGVPNFNIIQQPSQPNRVPNINNPTFAVNVPNQPNQLVNTGVPNTNINWPSQKPVNPGTNIILPTQPHPSQPINFPGININVPLEPSQSTIPVNSGINIPLNSGMSIPGNNYNVPTQPISQSIQPVYTSGININGENLINLLKVLITSQSDTGLPDKTGTSPNYITNNIPNVFPTVPSHVGNNVGIQYPTGNKPGPASSNVNIDLSKLIELLGLKISNVPNRSNPEISISNGERRPNLLQQPNIPEFELVNNLLKHLGDASGFDGKHLNNDHVKITIEKGQHESQQSIPHLTDMLLHYINKNRDTLLNSNNFESIRTEDNRPITQEVLLQFLNKMPNVGSNSPIVPSVVSPPVHNMPVIQFGALGQNTPNFNNGQPNYIPNVPMNIPSNGIVSGQVAIDPQYLATLMKTFSEVNLPNNYITSGVQPFMNKNVGTQSRAVMNSVLWNYLLAHLGCIPNYQPIGGNYIPNDGTSFFANQIPASNWAQVPQFSNMGMSFRNKRAAVKKS